jgi:hypothetical protein
MIARQVFAFVGNLPADARAARALEYIAHYLDRIDQSLESIATSLAADPGNAQLRNQLQSIERAIQQKT